MHFDTSSSAEPEPCLSKRRSRRTKKIRACNWKMQRPNEQKPDNVLPRDHGADMPTEATFYEIACAALSAELKRHGGPAQHLRTHEICEDQFFWLICRPSTGVTWITTARRCQTWTQRQSSSWGFATWACPNAVRSQTRNRARRSNWRWIFEAYFHYLDWCFGNSSNAQLATTTTPSFGRTTWKRWPVLPQFCLWRTAFRSEIWMWAFCILLFFDLCSMFTAAWALLELMHLR